MKAAPVLVLTVLLLLASVVVEMVMGPTMVVLCSTLDLDLDVHKRLAATMLMLEVNALHLKADSLPAMHFGYYPAHSCDFVVANIVALSQLHTLALALALDHLEIDSGLVVRDAAALRSVVAVESAFVDFDTTSAKKSYQLLISEVSRIQSYKISFLSDFICYL